MIDVDRSSRDAVIDSLVTLSRSADFRDRQDAGIALARFAESTTAARRLAELVLDPEDTAVTRATVEALIQRRDGVGLATVAGALASADDNHSDWIQTGVEDGLQMSEHARSDTLAVCLALREEHKDDAVRHGARTLALMLHDVGPVS
jgi:hypothetical protein